MLAVNSTRLGSLHLHALIWTSDCPKLTHETKEEYISFIDAHLQAYLPDIKTDPELYKLIATYQKHSHSRTCRETEIFLAGSILAIFSQREKL